MRSPDRAILYRAVPILRSVGRGALWIWAPTSIVLVALVMTSHVLALPTPAAHSVEAALEAQGIARGTWRAFHVLYAGCPCSRAVAEALIEQGTRQDFDETILLVGHDETLATRLGARHFRVRELTSEALTSEFGIEAAPVFFAVTPDGSVPYLGGYSERKQGQTHDAAILAEVRAGSRPRPLPVFGCAVSRELQAKADPLGLTYSQGDQRP